MLGLALEGGGARGAFHAGAFRALTELGYRFDGVAGTSIGAINGALIAQGDFELMYEWWGKLGADVLFDIRTPGADKLLSGRIDAESLPYLHSLMRDFVEKRGLDTAPIKKLLNMVINEDKLRLMNADFGMVTVNLTDMRPMELFKSDIPRGELVDYLMASAKLPIFRMDPIGGKRFIDGGFYDNCPLNMLAERGYDELIAIRTLSIGRTRRFEHPEVALKTIRPSRQLPSIMAFDRESTALSLRIGYCDAMREMSELKGCAYYIRPFSERGLIQRMSQMNSLSRDGLDPIQSLFQWALPRLAAFAGATPERPISEVALLAMERLAKSRGIDMYKLRDLPEFAQEIAAAPIKPEPAFARLVSPSQAEGEKLANEICELLS